MWYGWTYENGFWHRVTGPHETLSECSHALEKIAVARGVKGRDQCMTTGAVPRVLEMNYQS